MSQDNNEQKLNEMRPMTVKDYSVQASPFKITGVHVFIMVVMMFLGFAIGQITGLDNYKNLVTEKIEADVYATLEFATLNSMANADFNSIENELKSIKPIVKDEVAIIKLNELLERLKQTKVIYAKRRAEFQKELKSASQKKKLLYDTIKDNAKENKELKVSLAELYLLRLMELLSKKNSEKVEAFTPAENELISRVITNIITLSPQHEETITRLFPEISKKFIEDTNKK